MKKKFKTTLIIVGCSLLLFLMVFWTVGVNVVLAACVEGLCYMLFTWYCCKKYHTEDFSVAMILLSVVLGRYCLEIPVRVVDFWGTWPALHLTATCLLGILLGWVCYKNNKLFVWIICCVILVAYGYLLAEPWLNFCQEYIYGKK